MQFQKCCSKVPDGQYHITNRSSDCIQAAVVAQIAITALSLDYLSRTHWIARALWILSITSSLGAVYYANTLQNALGRLLNGRQVRAWLLGGFDAEWQPESQQRDANKSLSRSLLDLWQTVPHNNHVYWDAHDLLIRLLNFGSPFTRPGLPAYVPGVASVVTVSAPELLLSASVIALLTGLGVYLTFIWQLGLDEDAGSKNSMSVFIFFIVSTTISFAIYSLSRAMQEVVIEAPTELLDRLKTDFEERLESLKARQRQQYERVHRQQSDTRHEEKRKTQVSKALSRGSTKSVIASSTQSSSSSMELHRRPSTGPQSNEPDLEQKSAAGSDCIFEALQAAATLRRELASKDEFIAQLLEQLLRSRRVERPESS